jgi:hypothetical protein
MHALGLESSWQVVSQETAKALLMRFSLGK